MAPEVAQQLRHLISVLTVPVYFLVAFALYRRGLWRSYLFFEICLLMEGASLAALLLAGNNIPAYLFIYKISQPPIWVLYILMVIEVFQKVFIKFPGIARLAQRVVIASMLIAFAFALASIGGDLTDGWTGRSLVPRYSIILRTISSALNIFMLLIAAFLVWMPVPLPPNTIRHSLLYFFYFFVATGVHYVLNVNIKNGEWVQISNLVISLLTLAALGAWHLLLQPEGEIIPVLHPNPRTASSEMLARLESLNRTLSSPQK